MASSRQQQLGSLARANHVRQARAQLKRELTAGRVGLAEVLAEPPTYAQSAQVRDLLLALPGVGPVKAERALTRCGIAHAKTVTRLSARQRVALLEHLRR